MSKNREQFIQQSDNPLLTRRVLNQMCVPWKNLKAYPLDYRDASSGSSPGFVYYTDTIQFAKQNIFEILKILHQFNNETGSQLPPSNITEDETQYYNWLSWFALENTVQNLIEYLAGD